MKAQNKPARKAGRKHKQSITLPKLTITSLEVENPMFQREHAPSQSNPKKINAPFNLKESYAGFLYGRGHIDEAQWRAAGRIRQAYERLGGSGAAAMDYAREAVDGGQIAKTITDEHLRAAAYLRESHAVLGPEGHDLTLKLAGEGVWLDELSPSLTQRKYLGMRFRECLNGLAVHWKWKMRKIRAFSA